ncbi:MAG: TIGR00282 family metallophosphoesterase [Acidobacteria bacterium]|nr:TIGR00282 family metallophosphoesterase [Acidobacteriota bacterium]
MRILFVGDVIGRPGRRAVQNLLPDLIIQREVDLAIVNCENSASGFGVTPEIAQDLFDAGAHVLTSGNHVWDKKQILPYIEEEPRLLRPANYPDAPGSGVYIGTTDRGARYAVMNLQGRTYLPSIHCPFRTADELLETIDPRIKVRFVDFHAEVTSEKVAFGWHLDGRVSGVVGTHTHVPTADDRVLPGGTAYLTDCGMTGPINSVIGMNKEISIQRFLTGMPLRFEPAAGTVQLNAVLIDADDSTGKARSIEPVRVQID